LDISDGGPGAGSFAGNAVELAAVQGIVDAHGGTDTVTESGTGGVRFLRERQTALAVTRRKNEHPYRTNARALQRQSSSAPSLPLFQSTRQ
jgi:hypothetical protein